MRPLLSLIHREFTAYFLSLIGFVAIAFFLFFTGFLFVIYPLYGLTESGPYGVEDPMQSLLGHDLFWIVYALILPLLTMRLLAEERATGTLEMLLTAPIRDWQVVAGKYVGALLFYIVLWLPTLAYVPVLVDLDWSNFHARIDPAPVFATYFGVALVGAMFLAIGLFVSSLVRSQLVAALISLLISLGFVAITFLQLVLDPNSGAAQVVAYLSVPDHFRLNFTRGVIDTRHVVLYLSVTAFCLFLTVRSLEARRLRA